MNGEKCEGDRHVWRCTGTFLKGDPLCECGYVKAGSDGKIIAGGWEFYPDQTKPVRLTGKEQER